MPAIGLVRSKDKKMGKKATHESDLQQNFQRKPVEMGVTAWFLLTEDTSPLFIRLPDLNPPLRLTDYV